MASHPALILMLWLLPLLAACAPGEPVAPTPTALLSGPSALSLAVATNDFEVGRPRVPFVIFRGPHPLADARSITLTAYDLGSGTPVPRWTGEAQAYTDYDIPYWVIYPELAHAGYWGLGGVVTLADGTQATAQFTIEALPEPSGPALGKRPPASRNRTLGSQPDLALLTSDPSPLAALYEMTVESALNNGKPTVITFATPAYCESRLCAPVVDSVKAIYTEQGSQANFLHVEVYKSFNPLEYADEMAEWKLTSEPWTFVLDQNGRVAARVGGPVSPRELSALLSPLLGP
jgi:hypothetical protein